jgi:hypothetical protein
MTDQGLSFKPTSTLQDDMGFLYMLSWIRRVSVLAGMSKTVNFISSAKRSLKYAPTLAIRVLESC